MRRLVCWLRGHRWGEWELRPRVIAIRIEWLYWQRACSRCHRSDRRWFHVEPLRPPGRLSAYAYLNLIDEVAPDPETLPQGTPAGVLEWPP